MGTRYGLGLDAGGTYTDAVIQDYQTGMIVAAAKASTSQRNPLMGVRNALAQISPELLKQVGLVSLATTFATNAIVEDRGCEAGLILVGYDDTPVEIPPSVKVLKVQGGHTVSGKEKVPLDCDAVINNLNGFIEGLESIAVASFFSIRNPEHEIAVSKIIRSRCDLPVVCSHHLSMRLDAVKRATTAYWNARLIPLICNLIKAVADVLEESGIDAPLMVVKGDGTLISAKTAQERPVETILSGPAASIMGVKYLSGRENALIVDMGGTTTDIAIISKNKVYVDDDGVQVGNWKTHVRAAKVRTVGLGGDSLIVINGDGNLAVGPRRVEPLCVAAEKYPGVVKMLEVLLSIIKKEAHPNLVPTLFYLMPNDHREACCKYPILNNLAEKPINLYLERDKPEYLGLKLNLESFERTGIILRSSLTPTDLRVAKNRFRLGNRKASRLGLAIFSGYLGLSENEFIDAVEKTLTTRLSSEIITFIEGDNHVNCTLVNWWLQKNGIADNILDVQIKLNIPVVGVGAPAPEFLPKAVSKLTPNFLFPNYHEVSVAVGAVVGVVEKEISARIRNDVSGQYTLHTVLGKKTFSAFTEAVEYGRLLLEKTVREQMKDDYIETPLIEFRIEEKTFTVGYDQTITLETDIYVRATGKLF